MKMNIRLISLALIAGSMATVACAANYTALPDGVQINAADGCNVRLKAINKNTIRVSATPQKEFPADASLITVPQGATPHFELKPGADGGVRLITEEITASVNGKTGAVTFFDKNGRKIAEENPGGRTFTPINVEGTDGYTVSQSFASLDDEEGIYGLGQHQANEYNYKGKNEELFQYNTKVSVPFVVSTGNYGILWDSYSLCRWGNPADYSQLGEILTLYDKNGKKGALTGTYTAADGTTLVREEPKIYFEHL
ncbi:MAG: DUF4968 domain-containing protein, partial [Muribaculaceae bacterium]|nr:DUF4968 domain-containing protein [Muribaculaceae bacterium]